MPQYWLMKSEPQVYSWDNLVSDGWTFWDGVRNYQARNFMRDKMEIGDLVLFYHSNTKPPHIAGVATITKSGYPDYTSWDSKSKYFDEKSNPENPRWFMVNIEPLHSFDKIVDLQQIKENLKLSDMLVIKKGQRLSIQPVEKIDFFEVCNMGKLELQD